MKTEPTETLKNLIREVFDAYDSDGQDIENIVDYESAKKAVRSAFEEGQSSPKIKRLEWEKGDGEYWEAITPIGTYSITFDFGVYVALYDMDNAVDGEWRSLAKAKAAAQADFERRVMECLDL